MGKCEKDFDRKVFSFLYILLDALPSTLNFRKGKGLLLDYTVSISLNIFYSYLVLEVE